MTDVRPLSPPWSPAIADLARYRRARRLQHIDSSIYLCLLGWLDVTTYKACYLDAMALEFGVERAALSKSLRRLTAAGYLVRGADDPQAPAHARGLRPAWYRLAWIVTVPVPREESDNR
jgi:hypothetical protein